MRFKKKEPLQTQPRDAFPEYFYKPHGRGTAIDSFTVSAPRRQPVELKRHRSAVNPVARWERAGVRVLRSTQFERREVLALPAPTNSPEHALSLRTGLTRRRSQRKVNALI